MFLYACQTFVLNMPYNRLAACATLTVTDYTIIFVYARINAVAPRRSFRPVFVRAAAPVLRRLMPSLVRTLLLPHTVAPLLFRAASMFSFRRPPKRIFIAAFTRVIYLLTHRKRL